MANVIRDWTIIVYMAGDNNLSEEMITALKGMKCMANRRRINLIALYDSNYPPVPVKVYEFSKRVTVPAGSELPLAAYEFPLVNSSNPGDPRREFFKILDFVPMVLKAFPARKYALIFSGHSDGIIGRTLLRDENPPISLDVRALGSILRRVLPTNKQGNPQKFDLLGFDGCLMNMLEIGYEFRDVAQIFVASEGNIPTCGWNYRDILQRIKGMRQLSPTRFGKEIVEQFGKFNEDYDISGRSVNISACDLTKIEPFAKAVYSLAEHLYTILNSLTSKEDEAEDIEGKLATKKIVREHFIDCLQLAHLEAQSFLHNQAVDVLDFVHSLIGQSIKKLIEVQFTYDKEINKDVTQTIIRNLSNLYADYLCLLKTAKAYILCSRKPGKEYQFSTGVSIFFPWTRMAFGMMQERYSGLRFNRRKIWLDLIHKYTNLTCRDERKDFVAELQKISIGRGFDVHLLSIHLYTLFAHKEFVGKEFVGKGDPEAFYSYFSEFRNYNTDFN